MKKLFTSDNFFIASTILAIVCRLTGEIIGICLGWFTFASLFSIVLCSIFIAVLYWSYKIHSKNVMKGILGALLTANLMGYIEMFSTISKSATIFSIIMVVLAVILFINHFVINSDHHSSPFNVHCNQGIILIIFVIYLIWDIMFLISSTSATEAICTTLDVIGYPATLAVVVCVETRLDVYRQNREAAGWTEEKGYPKGYVHEYEKK